MVKLLLDHGAAANVVSIDSLEMMKNGPLALGRLTPLHFAAGQANFETVELLVKAGADVNAQDIRGSTPLAFAVATDHADARIVSLLHAKGAALDLARMYRNPEVLTALGLPAPAKIEEPASAMAPARGIAASLEKGIAVLQASSPKFLERGGCPACHAQHHTAVAAAAAKASGVKVDWAQEIEQAGVTASLRGGIEQQLFQVIDPPPGVDGMEFSLLQTSAAGLAPKLATDSLVFFIAAMQRKEGDWPNYGVVRPPLEDGGFSHTAKGIRVLQQNLLPGRKAEFEERIARAAGWLEKSAPRTTEDRTMQLLGIRWANRNAPESRVRELIALQRASGGWGQTENLPSDAYATGEALYALHETGMPATDAVYRRGAGFLLRTQHEDGSWLVKTRAAGFQPYFESGFPHGHDQWISQSGTAWAAIALSYANQ